MLAIIKLVLSWFRWLNLVVKALSPDNIIQSCVIRGNEWKIGRRFLMILQKDFKSAITNMRFQIHIQIKHAAEVAKALEPRHYRRP